MTKQEYEKKYDECNNWLGNIIVCKEYISSLEAENSALKSSTIVWHKYPDEKPNITNDDAIHPLLAVVGNGKQAGVEMVLYRNGTWYRADMGWYQDEQILYWAEMPAPPEGALKPGLQNLRRKSKCSRERNVSPILIETIRSQK